MILCKDAQILYLQSHSKTAKAALQASEVKTITATKRTELAERRGRKLRRQLEELKKALQNSDKTRLEAKQNSDKTRLEAIEGVFQIADRQASIAAKQLQEAKEALQLLQLQLLNNKLCHGKDAHIEGDVQGRQPGQECIRKNSAKIMPRVNVTSAANALKAANAANAAGAVNAGQMFTITYKTAGLNVPTKSNGSKCGQVSPGASTVKYVPQCVTVNTTSVASLSSHTDQAGPIPALPIWPNMDKCQSGSSAQPSFLCLPAIPSPTSASSSKAFSPNPAGIINSSASGKSSAASYASVAFSPNPVGIANSSAPGKSSAASSSAAFIPNPVGIANSSAPDKSSAGAVHQIQARRAKIRKLRRAKFKLRGVKVTFPLRRSRRPK